MLVVFAWLASSCVLCCAAGESGHGPIVLLLCGLAAFCIGFGPFFAN
jgi:hypothetical protein